MTRWSAGTYQDSGSWAEELFHGNPPYPPMDTFWTIFLPLLEPYIVPLLGNKMFRCTFFVHFYHGKEHRYHHNSMAIAITAKNTEATIAPCYKVLSMDMDLLGSQNCVKSSKAFKTSTRRPKTVPGATRVGCRVRCIKKLELKSQSSCHVVCMFGLSKLRGC